MSLAKTKNNIRRYAVNGWTETCLPTKDASALATSHDRLLEAARAVLNNELFDSQDTIWTKFEATVIEGEQ